MKYNLSLFDKQIDGDQTEEGIEKSIINEIKESVFRQETKEAILILIRNNQTALNIYKQRESLREKCDEVQYYLEKHFYQYLDESFPVSDIGMRELITKTNFVIAEIKELVANFDEDFKRTLQPLYELQPVNELQPPKTIHYAHYVNDFCNTWTKEFVYTGQDQEYHKELLIRFLITYNYNYPAFIEYITNQVFERVSHESNPHAQLETLHYYLRQISGIPSCSIMSFSIGFDSVKMTYKAWLTEEIKYVTKQIKNYSPAQLNLYQHDDSKIETSLSVAETAYFAKLMYTSGVTTNSSQQEVLQVISKTVKTKKTAKLSLGSLQNKYYEVEERTKESIKKILMTMLNNIK